MWESPLRGFVLVLLKPSVLTLFSSRHGVWWCAEPSPETTDLPCLWSVLPSRLPNPPGVGFSPRGFLPCQVSRLISFCIADGQLASHRTIPKGPPFGDVVLSAPLPYRKECTAYSPQHICAHLLQVSISSLLPSRVGVVGLCLPSGGMPPPPRKDAVRSQPGLFLAVGPLGASLPSVARSQGRPLRGRRRAGARTSALTAPPAPERTPFPSW